jgi:hypothetical protein
MNKKNVILRITALLLLLIAFTATAAAQSGLSVNKLFDGRYKNQKNAIEVLVKGKKLQPYKLTLFRSLTLKGNKEELLDIERTVRQDAARSIDKETGMIGSRIYYGFYRFAPVGGKYRYLFFRNNSLRRPDANDATVVYMEGYATIAELKAMFK